MGFYKETIIGQVLSQVRKTENNEFYLNKIDDLLESIEDMEYIGVETKPWNKYGVIVTDKKVSPENKHPDWVFVETDDVTECSWLIERLYEIYKPTPQNAHRLLTTIGYLLNIYNTKYSDISEILRIVTVTSTVFLHPDHLGLDRFKIRSINLPQFGSEF